MGYRRPALSDLIDVDDRSRTDRSVLKWDSESQSHIYAELTSDTLEGLNEKLSEKSSVGHTHTISDVTQLSSTLEVKADLIDGKIPTSQLPSIAISEFLGRAADEDAMILLVGQRGDYCYREDLQAAFWLTTDDPTDAENWLQVALPSVSVQSVNGQTGTVVIGYSEVGAAAASHSHAISGVTGLQDALDSKAGLSSANVFTANLTVNANQIAVTGSNPQVVMTYGGSSSSGFLRMRDTSLVQGQITKQVVSGEALLELEAAPVDGTSRSIVRVGRSINTTGLVTFQVCKGDGTSAVNCQLGGNGNSYVNALTGNFSIGTTSASEKLTVNGNISASRVILGDGTYNSPSILLRNMGFYCPTNNNLRISPTATSNQYLEFRNTVAGISPVIISESSWPGYTVDMASDTTSHCGYNYFHRSGGTHASRTAVTNGSNIGTFGWRGHDGVALSNQDNARLQVIATETHTETANGTAFVFYSTANGSATQVESLRLSGPQASIPGFLTFSTALSETGVSNNSLFRRSSDNKLCWKDNDGTVTPLS